METGCYSLIIFLQSAVVTPGLFGGLLSSESIFIQLPISLSKEDLIGAPFLFQIFVYFCC